MRETLPQTDVEPKALQSIKGFHANVVKTVKDTVKANPVVVVGMAQNPVVKKARKALDEKKVTYKYIEYGNYFSKWHERLAIKLWSGWPTYPQVFIDGKLIGGNAELQDWIAAGKLK